MGPFLGEQYSVVISEGPFPPRGSVCQLCVVCAVWPRASYKHENKALFLAIYFFRGAVMLPRIEA